MKKIFTHNGVFHADEVMACALLRNFPMEYGDVVRTRDLSRVSDGNDYVIDVGMVYDENGLKFDHHQKGVGSFSSDYTFEMASAGLVLKSLNIEEELKTFLYERVIGSIDSQDNSGPVAGVFSFSTYISTFNYVDVYGPEQDKQFDIVVKLCFDLLENLEEEYDLLAANSIIVENAIRDSSERILILERFVPDFLAILDRHMGPGFYDRAIWPDQGSGFKIRAIPADIKDNGSITPIKSAGLDGEIFIHASGFIAGAETMATAMAMAKA